MFKRIICILLITICLLSMTACNFMAENSKEKLEKTKITFIITPGDYEGDFDKYAILLTDKQTQEKREIVVPQTNSSFKTNVDVYPGEYSIEVLGYKNNHTTNMSLSINNAITIVENEEKTCDIKFQEKSKEVPLNVKIHLLNSISIDEIYVLQFINEKDKGNMIEYVIDRRLSGDWFINSVIDEGVYSVKLFKVAENGIDLANEIDIDDNAKKYTATNTNEIFNVYPKDQSLNQSLITQEENTNN